MFNFKNKITLSYLFLSLHTTDVVMFLGYAET
jgi:hypothetical protein